MVRTHAITDTQTDSHTHRLRLTVYAETHSTRRQEAVGYKNVSLWGNKAEYSA